MSLYQKAFFTGIGRIFTLPRLSIPLILTLGLALGAVLTISSISNTLLLKPLKGVTHAKDIDVYKLSVEVAPNVTFVFTSVKKLASISQYFKDIGDWGSVDSNDTSIMVDNTRYKVTKHIASNNMLALLGTKILLGEGFDITNTENYLWISESLWHSAYKKSIETIGKPLTIKNKTYQIAGVIEDATALSGNPRKQQIWQSYDLARQLAPDAPEVEGMISQIFVNTKNGTKKRLNKADFEQWHQYFLNEVLPDKHRIEEQNFYGKLNKELMVSNYREFFLGSNADLLKILWIVILSLLVMSILNLLSMLLAHYDKQSRNFSLQITMGCKLRRLHLIVWLENLPLILLAVIIGCLSAGWLIKLLPILSNNSIKLIDQISITPEVITFIISIAVLINTLFSSFALRSVNKKNLQENISSSGKGLNKKSDFTLNKILMTLQLIITSILVTGCIYLAIQSYNIVYRDLGVNPTNVFTASIHRDRDDVQKFEDKNDKQHYQKNTKKRLNDIIAEHFSNVTHIVNDVAPISDSYSINIITKDDSKPIFYRLFSLSDNYFQQFNIPFLAGSNLSTDEIENQANKIVLDESFARVSFPELPLEEIIGKEFKLYSDQKVPEIVQGIIPTLITNASHKTSDIGTLTLFSPQKNSIKTFDSTFRLANSNVKQRDLLLKKIETAFPGFKASFTSMEEVIHAQTRMQRLSMWMTLSVCLLIITLAAIGISGITQMSSNNRKFELAVRMATGANQIRLIKLIVQDASLMLLLGLGAGFIINVFAHQFFQTQIKTLPDFNWAIILILNTCLIAIVLASVIIPAWRVIKKDPMQVLREE